MSSKEKIRRLIDKEILVGRIRITEIRERKKTPTGTEDKTKLWCARIFDGECELSFCEPTKKRLMKRIGEETW
jgi:hypothetical protein